MFLEFNTNHNLFMFVSSDNKPRGSAGVAGQRHQRQLDQGARPGDHQWINRSNIHPIDSNRSNIIGSSWKLAWTSSIYHSNQEWSKGWSFRNKGQEGLVISFSFQSNKLRNTKKSILFDHGGNVLWYNNSKIQGFTKKNLFDSWK